MPNELFSFSVIRPLQKTDQNNPIIPNIQLYPDKYQSSFRNDLIKAKLSHVRKVMIERSHSFRNSDPTFIRDLKTLSMPIVEIDGWLIERERKIKHIELQAQFKSLFIGAGIGDWRSWVKGDKFYIELGKLADSFVACLIDAELDVSARDLRSQLLRAIHIARLLERSALDDATLDIKDAIRISLQAIAILPIEIFPLPLKDTTKEQDQIVAPYNNFLKAIENSQNKTIDKLTEINRFQKAGNEIISLHRNTALPERANNQQVLMNRLALNRSNNIRLGRKHVASKKGSPATTKSTEYNLNNKDSPWILTNAANNKMTKDTHNILNKIGLNSKSLNARIATQEINRRVMELSNDLNFSTPNRVTIRIGDNFFDKSTIDPLQQLNSDMILPSSSTVGIPLVSSVDSPVAQTVTVPSGKGDVHPIGRADLLVVREELVRYEAGAIAHIENVLSGEKKTITHERISEKEQTNLLETEETTESERDQQTTDRTELQTSADKTVQQKIDAKAGVDASYKGLNFEVKANAGFTYDRATQESSKIAQTAAHEIVDKTVSKMQHRTKEQQVTRTKETVNETNLHELNNENKSDHVVGIYRWVDEIHRAEIVNYGRRLMFEFIIPEPAAFFKYSEANTKIEGMTIDKPDPPQCLKLYNPIALNMGSISSTLQMGLIPPLRYQPLQPDDLNENNYLGFVQKYNVQGVEPPPPLYKWATTRINEVPSNNDTNLVPQNLGQLTIEDGYEAISAYIGGDFIRNKDGSYMRIAIGKNNTEFPDGPHEIPLSYETGAIQIAVQFYAMCTIGITIEVACLRTAEILRKWQLKTYAAIMNAYIELKKEYDNQLKAAKIKMGVEIQGRNPLKNREIEEVELKKAALILLTGQQFDLFDAMRKSIPPAMDIKEAKEEGRYIQFFEQAFEWDNMSYIFYPYFWGRKSDWVDDLHLLDSDPKFEKFLKAGAARVLVPVRLGYDDAIEFYLKSDTGVIWEGGDPPGVDDKLYFSIIDSIKEDQGHIAVDGVGELIVKHGQEAVIGKGTRFSEENDENRDIYIRSEKYRIAYVEDKEHILLREKYNGKDEEHVTYELGLKFVGEPWEFTVPTSEVYLQQDKVLLPNLAEERKKANK